MTSFSTMACKSQEYIELLVRSQCFAVVLAIFIRTFYEAPSKFLQLCLDAKTAQVRVESLPTCGEMNSYPISVTTELDSTPLSQSDTEEFALIDEQPLVSAVSTLEASEQQLEANVSTLLEEEMKLKLNNEVHSCMQSDLENELLAEMQSDLCALCDDLMDMETDTS